MLGCVDLVRTDVSEELSASFIRVTRIGELGTTLAVTSNRGSVDRVPDPLLLRKSDSAGNRARDLWICGQEILPLDHRGGPRVPQTEMKNVSGSRARVVREADNLTAICDPIA
jgi:hypothetical protein